MDRNTIESRAAGGQAAREMWQQMLSHGQRAAAMTADPEAATAGFFAVMALLANESLDPKLLGNLSPMSDQEVDQFQAEELPSGKTVAEVGVEYMDAVSGEQWLSCIKIRRYLANPKVQADLQSRLAQPGWQESQGRD